MSSWTTASSASGAPLWAATMLNVAPSATNRTNLYENSSAGTFISGATHGLFNYNASETQSGKVAHSGWVLKTTGSGGRANRVQYTTLVCLTSNA
tara:strand:+ start:1310 stop:1594 length:285 start_codon:yes stop_codon:yes gene_type:complete